MAFSKKEIDAVLARRTARELKRRAAENPASNLPEVVKYNLLPGEEILYAARIRRMSLAGFIVLYVLAALPLLGGYVLGALFLFLGVHGSYLFVQFRRNQTSLVLTDRRVIGTRWENSKREIFDLPLSKVESMLVEEVASGAYGTVRISGVGSAVARFEWVEQPGRFRQRLLEEMGRVNAE